MLGHLFRASTVASSCLKENSDLPSVGGTLQAFLSFPRSQPDAGYQDRAGSCV